MDTPDKTTSGFGDINGSPGEIVVIEPKVEVKEAETQQPNTLENNFVDINERGEIDDGPYVPPPPKPPEEYVPTYSSALFSGFLFWAGLFIIALFLFGIGTQVLHYYAIVAALPFPFQWLFLTGGSVCLLVFVVVIIKIIALYIQVKRNTIQSLLSERKRWQSSSAATDNERKKEARELLKKHLICYFQEKKSVFSHKQQETDSAMFKRLGMKESEIKELEQAKSYLLSPSNNSDPEKWIQDYQTNFQKHLDDLAKQRVSAYFYKVFYGTAISPRSIVDQAIVTLALSSMVHDLLRIYRLKPAPGQTVFLLVHAFFNVYASGNMQEVTEKAVDATGNALSTTLNSDTIRPYIEAVTNSEEFAVITSNGVVAMIPFVGRGLATITAKIGEGAINAFLLRNLGRQIIAWIQPTRPT